MSVAVGVHKTYETSVDFLVASHVSVFKATVYKIFSTPDWLDKIYDIS